MKDLIERLNYIKNWKCGGDSEMYKTLNDAISVLEDLTFIQPERKTGKWVNNLHDIPICDQCGYMTPYDRAIDDYEYGNYCPNCGADMRGEQECTKKI